MKWNQFENVMLSISRFLDSFCFFRWFVESHVGQKINSNVVMHIFIRTVVCTLHIMWYAPWAQKMFKFSPIDALNVCIQYHRNVCIYRWYGRHHGINEKSCLIPMVCIHTMSWNSFRSEEKKQTRRNNNNNTAVSFGWWCYCRCLCCCRKKWLAHKCQTGSIVSNYLIRYIHKHMHTHWCWVWFGFVLIHSKRVKWIKIFSLVDSFNITCF